MFLPRGDVKWRKVRQAHYHSTTYIKCYGNIIHFISSYTFPLNVLRLNKMLNFRGSVTAASTEAGARVCVCGFACAHVTLAAGLDVARWASGCI